MIPPRLLVACAALAALWPSPAPAGIRTRLDAGVAERCPDPSTITARWRSRSGSAAAVELHILEVSGRLLGVMRVAVDGQPPAARRLRAERDACSALVDALLTSAALMTATLELPPIELPPSEPPAAESTARPSSAGSIAAGSTDDPPAGPQVEASAAPADDAGPWRLTLAARGELGTAPTLSGLGELGLAHHWTSVSLGAALQGGAAPSAGVGDGAVSVERYAASAHACWHPGAIGLCLLGRAGGVVLRPDGLDGDDVVEALIEAGGRVTWRQPLGAAWALVADLEVSAPLRPLRLSIDDAPVWQASPVAAGAGLALQWAP